MPEGEIGEKITKLFKTDEKDTSKFCPVQSRTEPMLMTVKQISLFSLPWARRPLLRPRRLPDRVRAVAGLDNRSRGSCTVHRQCCHTDALFGCLLGIASAICLWLPDVFAHEDFIWTLVIIGHENHMWQETAFSLDPPIQRTNYLYSDQIIKIGWPQKNRGSLERVEISVL